MNCGEFVLPNDYRLPARRREDDAAKLRAGVPERVQARWATAAIGVNTLTERSLIDDLRGALLSLLHRRFGVEGDAVVAGPSGMWTHESSRLERDTE